MKIVVIGAGAMGSIYGSHLSKHNEVYLIDTNPDIVKTINTKGLKLQENGEDVLYRPNAVCSSKELGKADLVILFVKALYSAAALENNKNIIGKDTYLMTLQNGSGHEDIMVKAASLDHIIIGTTEDNGAILEAGYIRHGGTGRTNIGMLAEDKTGMLAKVKTIFDACGFDTVIRSNIQQLIWDKLLTNVSLSVVTGVLQVKMGFIAEDPSAWDLTKALLTEALSVATAMGLNFNEEEVTERLRKTSKNNPEGCTSIYMDLMNGRRTEVDTISGSVVRSAEKYGVKVPTHKAMVNIVHAMENRNK